jgi:streptogramin lyase
MKARLLLSILAATLCCCSLTALACRPFGSYEFVEDKEGGIWFTEGDNNAISRLAPNGNVTVHRLPTPNAEPSSLAQDSSGNIWFVEMAVAKIGRLARNGTITEIATGRGHPSRIAVDHKGEAWFTQMSGHENKTSNDLASSDTHAHAPKPDTPSDGALVGRIDGQGKIHTYPLPEGWPTSIAFSHGDQAWVSILIPGDQQSKPKGRLMRLSGEGQWRVVAAWENSCPRNLLAGPRGAVYFSDGCRGIVGISSPQGELKEWPLPEGTNIQQMSLVLGATPQDNRLWFTDRQHLGYIDPQGKVTLVTRPDNGDATMGILVTHNGDVVFSEFYNYNINRLGKNGEFVEHLISVDERRGSREIKEGEFCRVEFGARIAAKAEMDQKRREEVKLGRFKPDGQGTEKLVEQKCLVCHDARRLLLSRRSDWTPSLTRMHSYRQQRGVTPLSPEETSKLVRYFNKYYGLGRQSEVGSMMR